MKEIQTFNIWTRRKLTQNNMMTPEQTLIGTVLKEIMQYENMEGWNRCADYSWTTGERRARNNQEHLGSLVWRVHNFFWKLAYAQNFSKF